ncbi:MAG: 3-dehydroquinate synthase [Chitinophagaceae bacterium]|nr:3-dehydroquinate synthase [Chitinophagaceae bacterium]
MHNIDITNNISDSLHSFFLNNTFSQKIILMDSNTALHCFPLLPVEIKNTSHTIIIESGEKEKNIHTCQYIWEQMTHHQLDRKALMILLGGGVIGDMGGFCAATYKRGIAFITIPTTLLSQVDASIGGKLGIDFQGLKNHIGLFTNPIKTFIHSEFLKTLPKRELHSGFAEVIKHTLIADKKYWNEITQNTLETQNWEKNIQNSLAIKSEIVTKDPHEQNYRKILNFGHTIGHALESAYLKTNTPLLHGEAIAIGMVLEAFISFKKCGLPRTEFLEIFKYIQQTFPLSPIEASLKNKIFPYILQDKKNTNNNIQASLLLQIGKAVFDIPITFQDIESSIEYYNAFRPH